MPSAPRITSRKHPVVTRCRALARRRADDAVLLDGEHLVSEALAWHVAIEVVLAGPRADAGLIERVSRTNARVHPVSVDVLEAASPVTRPSGVLAIARWAPASVDDALDATPDAGPALGLVSVQDPGNLGSAIRAADALGARGVLALDESADPGGWKALRGAMGSAFHLPVARGDAREAVTAATRRGLVVAAAVARGSEVADPSVLPPASLVLLGNEGAGLPADLVALATLRVAVPMRAGVESLNVAVTAALILDAARRAVRRQVGS